MPLSDRPCRGARGDTVCSCPKTDCPRHGVCCECILFHREREGEPVVKRLPHCMRFLLHGVEG